jgi:hypothetical protein
MVADQVKYTSQVSKEQTKVTNQVKEVENHVLNYAGAAQGRGNNHAQQARQVRDPPSEDDKAKKRIRQAINKAEKASLLMGLDLGEVPTMNKETLARKVTIDLHKKGKNGAGGAGYSDKQVETVTDDLLTCANLEFLGSATQRYNNRFNSEDPNNGKYCTVPVKMVFKSKKERIQAEQHLRKVCNVKCSTPYPKRLRSMIADLVKEAKAKKDCFILAKVHVDSLTISAHGSVNNRWEDLGISKEIPLNVLDRYEAMEAERDMEVENSENAL